MRKPRPACASVQFAFIIPYLVNTIVQLQGSHRLEKYLNIKNCLGKVLEN